MPTRSALPLSWNARSLRGRDRTNAVPQQSAAACFTREIDDIRSIYSLSSGLSFSDRSLQDRRVISAAPGSPGRLSSGRGLFARRAALVGLKLIKPPLGRPFSSSTGVETGRAALGLLAATIDGPRPIRSNGKRLLETSFTACAPARGDLERGSSASSRCKMFCVLVMFAIVNN